MAEVNKRRQLVGNEALLILTEPPLYCPDAKDNVTELQLDDPVQVIGLEAVKCEPYILQFNCRQAYQV